MIHWRFANDQASKNVPALSRFQSARYGDEEDVRAALDEGTDASAADSSGKTGKRFGNRQITESIEMNLQLLRQQVLLSLATGRGLLEE